jgi:hypothetical protein
MGIADPGRIDATLTLSVDVVHRCRGSNRVDIDGIILCHSRHPKHQGQ